MLRTAFALLAWMAPPLLGAAAPGVPDPVLLNDVHSRLNPTQVREVAFPVSSEEVIELVLEAGREDVPISISGGRHAMGGQQFGTGTLHLSMSRMDDVLAFDRENGIVTVEAGIQWPALIDYLTAVQKDDPAPWGIAQKQTGADNLSIGGALSANVHGRGLTMRPIVQDVVAFRLVDAEGKEREVSRSRNPELFRLVIGGYGLFGVITSVDLKLAPRIKLRRDVQIIPLSRFAESVTRRVADGYLYGDLQFKTDEHAEDFLQVGVFSTYRPVAMDTPIPEDRRSLTTDMWHRLLALAHSDKAQAFTAYANYYLATDGQIYWSDTHQLGFYDRNYESYLEATLSDYRPGSLMISEVYVPMDRLVDFMQVVADDVREHGTDVIYGTIRLIREDDETFLPWARRDYACIVINLRVPHTEPGPRQAREAFQRLIDRALERDGSYFLTYHRWARKDQLLRAYPQFPAFLRLKLKHDPEERFQSDWYRYYRDLLAPELGRTEHAD
jgi:FAD/FMN-containing dehydrogenase